MAAMTSCANQEHGLVNYKKKLAWRNIVLNKVSLVMQLPENIGGEYQRFEGPSSGVTDPSHETSISDILFIYFQVVASLPTKACSFDWHYLHWQSQFKKHSTTSEYYRCKNHSASSYEIFCHNTIVHPKIINL